MIIALSILAVLLCMCGAYGIGYVAGANAVDVSETTPWAMDDAKAEAVDVEGYPILNCYRCGRAVEVVFVERIDQRGLEPNAICPCCLTTLV